ncbi:hypothetical protein ABG768_012466 [Culter alburnus]|uniref:BESS domain-containing protein n=1 Tax=Culter alburnus TaxID=194366 RepID=A0AAW2B242_CULAL
MVLKSSKSGAGAEDVYLPKWKYYHIMSFLRDTCTPEESSDNFTTVLAALSTSQCPEIITSSPSTSTSTYTSTPTTPPQLHPHKAVSEPKKQKIDKATEAMQYAMGFLKRKASSQHTGFLHYLESCLESLPDNKAKKLKRQIIELAHAVQDED